MEKPKPRHATAKRQQGEDGALVRALRIAGAFTFLLAGLAYIFLPPVTTTKYLESEWPAAAWGGLFAIGGLVGIYGISIRIVQYERFGWLLVWVASACLSLTQALVMADGPVWTRAGGTLIYISYTVWGLERWLRLADDEDAVRELPERERAARQRAAEHETTTDANSAE